MSRWLSEGWDLESVSGPEKTQASRPETSARPAVSVEVLEALRAIGIPMEETDPAPDATGDPVAWQLLAHCLEEMGEVGGAQRCYRRAARDLVRSSRPTPPVREDTFEPLPFAVFLPVRDDRSH